MSKEAIEEAIEVLEDASADMLMETGDKNYYVEAIAVLRQALVEPEQKSDPSAWHGWVLREVLFDNGEPIGHREPEQEPVAWISESENLLSWDKFYDHMKPLYTAQPKREWVGLTDEEVYECEQLAAIQYQRHKYSVHGQIITPADGLEWHFAGVIEAKLKEKNT